MLKNVCATLVVAAAAVLCAAPASAQSQSWDQVYAGQGRFTVLNQFNGEAVLDRETGLVWQRTLQPEGLSPFPVASRYCIDLVAGNRRGWRLPTIVELLSVTDASQSFPSLTPGHPFENLDLEKNYWSSTTTTDWPDFVWGMSLPGGRVARLDKCLHGGCGVPKSEPVVWCVRGGGGLDPQ